MWFCVLVGDLAMCVGGVGMCEGVGLCRGNVSVGYGYNVWAVWVSGGAVCGCAWVWVLVYRCGYVCSRGYVCGCGLGVCGQQVWVWGVWVHVVWG